MCFGRVFVEIGLYELGANKKINLIRFQRNKQSGLPAK